MQDRPTAGELLEAVRTFLADEVLPSLEGRRRFHALVASNVLAIVGRELHNESADLSAEWRRLVDLLGTRAEEPRGLPALRASVRELTERLAGRIRQGDADAGPFAAAVRNHVRASVREKLAIANPDFSRA